MKKLILALAFVLLLASCASNTSNKTVIEQTDSTQVVTDSTAVDTLAVPVQKEVK